MDRGQEYLALARHASQPSANRHGSGGGADGGGVRLRGVGAGLRGDVAADETALVVMGETWGGGEGGVRTPGQSVRALNSVLVVGAEVEVLTQKQTSAHPPSSEWWNARIDKIAVRRRGGEVQSSRGGDVDGLGFSSATGTPMEAALLDNS